MRYLIKISYYKIMEERFYNIYNSAEKLESKKLGEVYTPEYMVKNMVDQIPDEVWMNKDIKVLDFACGTGIFAFFIYKKLIKYFDHDYVMNNVLYFNDIQEKNIKKINYIFDNPRNVHNGDFLTWNCNMKFDVIIGNPPFQAHDNKKSNGNAIWHKFVDKLLLLLNDGGYLSLIHPSGWRKPSTEKCKYTYLYYELTQKRQMIYLEIHSQKEGIKNFKCDIKYDIYLVENVMPHKNTKVIYYDKNVMDVDLKKLKFIPNNNIEFIFRLLNCKGNNIRIVYSSSVYDIRRKHVSSTRDSLYKYPLIHSITRNGLKYKYSSRNDLGHFGVSKIVITLLPGVKNTCQHYIDIEGKYGMTSNVFGIEVDSVEYANKIATALSTEKFRIFKDAFNFHTRTLEFRSFYYFTDGIWNLFLEQ